MVSALTHTRLRQPWLRVARSAWVVVSLITIGFYGLAIIYRVQAPAPSCTIPNEYCNPWTISREDMLIAQQIGMTPWLVTIWSILADLVAKGGFIMMGLLVFWRKSDDWLALLMSIMLISFSIEGQTTYLGSLEPIGNTLYIFAVMLYLLIPFIFPNGRFEPRWMRWIVLVMLVVIVLFVVNVIAQLNLVPWSETLVSISLVWLLLAAYAVVYRYRRRASPQERQQIKWVMSGILGYVLFYIPILIGLAIYPPNQPSQGRVLFVLFVSQPVYVLLYLLVASTLAMSILRYRLWDIDILIRRTLQYSVLSSLLILTYFVIVILLQRLLGTGQSQLITVLSTLAIAALFLPTRQRVQAFIDKRFYRRKYDAQQILAAFATYARDETDIELLTAQFAAVVHETLQPEQVQVWIAQQGAK